MFTNPERNEKIVRIVISIFTVIMMAIMIKLFLSMHTGGSMLEDIKARGAKPTDHEQFWKIILGAIIGVRMMLYTGNMLTDGLDQVTLINRKTVLIAIIGTMICILVSCFIDIVLLYLILNWSFFTILIGLVYLIFACIAGCNSDRQAIPYSLLFLSYSLYSFLHDYGRYQQKVSRFEIALENYLKLAKY